MKRSSLYAVVALAAIFATVYSCKKINGINNQNVIETPFALYFCDTSGTLFLTNDGKNISPVIFPPDGKPCRSLVTSGNNILWAKDSLYYSTNNGTNFNHAYDSLIWKPDTAVNGAVINLNQSMMITTSWNNRVYVGSRAPDMYDGGTLITNYMGLVYSDQNGALGSWHFENQYDTTHVGKLKIKMYSFTQLANGALCAIAFEKQRGPIAAGKYNLRYQRNFYKSGLNSVWLETTANPDNSGSIYPGNMSGSPLPPYGTTTMTDSSFFTLGHFNNRLIAIDNRGKYGAWYSDDYGANWNQYTGLPNRPLRCISAPFEEVCLIGTDSAGLYVLNVNTGMWQQNNSGLASNLIVRNIAFKQNIFKNGNIQKYIYLATNKGIFQSTDGGINWILTIPGNYTVVY